MEPTKNILANVGLVIVSIGVGALLVEGLLHVLPGTMTGIHAEIPLEADPDIAFRHKGNVSLQMETQCFSVLVSTNSLGFRDAEWSEPQTIAVLGDSFTEAAQVADGQDISARLEAMLGVPVMNLGAASFGTVAELYVYEKFARPQKPKVTLLLMYPGNDISDNDCAGSRGPNGTVTKPCGEVADGVVTFNTNYYSTSGNHALRSFVRENCRLCRILRELPARFSGKKSETVPRPDDAISETGLAVTEEALRQLNKRVTEHGGTLIVAIVPDYRTAEEGKVQPEETAAREILQKLNIQFIPLTEAFLAYKDEHVLPDPYFSYRCDGHWNPVGHELAAAQVGKYLIEQKMFSNAMDIPVPAPKEILGEDGYHSVYEGGTYRK